MRSPNEEEAREYFVETAIILSALCAAIYDAIIGLAREQQYIWRRPMNAATVVYTINRYGIILFYLIVALSKFNTAMSRPSCIARGIVETVLFVLLKGSISVFTTLRIYAIWGKSVKLGALMLCQNILFVVSSVSIFNTAGLYVTDCVSQSVSSNLHTSVKHRALILDFPSHLFVRLQILYPISRVMVDISVLLLTWAKTWEILSLLSASQRRHTAPISTVLLRDGTLHFSIFLCLNVTQLVLSYTEPQTFTLAYGLVPFSLFDSTLTCHIIYHLHEVYLPSSIAGPLGAPIDVTYQFDTPSTHSNLLFRKESISPLAEYLLVTPGSSQFSCAARHNLSPVSIRSKLSVGDIFDDPVYGRKVLAYICANDLRREGGEDVEGLILTGSDDGNDDGESVDSREAELESLIQTVPRQADEPMPRTNM